MLENPYLPPIPGVAQPEAAAAWAEGFTKGLIALSSPQPSDSVGPNEIDAFNKGVADGLNCADNGIELGDPCVPASEEAGDGGLAIAGAEIAHAAWEARQLKTLTAGIACFVIALFELACELPVHTLPPEQVLPSMGKTIADRLAEFGCDSMELFCGAGLDPTATDCEIRISNLYKSQDQARQAAIAMNRRSWLVASWRTDQCNSFKVVDSN